MTLLDALVVSGFVPRAPVALEDAAGLNPPVLVNNDAVVPACGGDVSPVRSWRDVEIRVSMYTHSTKYILGLHNNDLSAQQHDSLAQRFIC